MVKFSIFFFFLISFEVIITLKGQLYPLTPPCCNTQCCCNVCPNGCANPPNPFANIFPNTCNCQNLTYTCYATSSIVPGHVIPPLPPLPPLPPIPYVPPPYIPPPALPPYPSPCNPPSCTVGPIPKPLPPKPCICNVQPCILPCVAEIDGPTLPINEHSFWDYNDDFIQTPQGIIIVVVVILLGILVLFLLIALIIGCIKMFCCCCKTSIENNSSTMRVHTYQTDEYPPHDNRQRSNDTY